MSLTPFYKQLLTFCTYLHKYAVVSCYYAYCNHGWVRSYNRHQRTEMLYKIPVCPKKYKLKIYGRRGNGRFIFTWLYTYCSTMGDGMTWPEVGLIFTESNFTLISIQICYYRPWWRNRALKIRMWIKNNGDLDFTLKNKFDNLKKSI